MRNKPLIFNVMLGRRKGGIEQSFVDYCRMLNDSGHNVMAIVDTRCSYLNDLKKHNIRYQAFTIHGLWDLWSWFCIYRFFREKRPTITICHGNRALYFTPAKLTTIIHVAHNFLFKRTHKADYFFGITQSMVTRLEKIGVKRDRVFLMPNVCDFKRSTFDKAWHNPIRVGTLGRFVEKKGFDYFIAALSELRLRGIPFEAILGGDGPLKKDLIDMIHQYKLKDQIFMPGWILNKVDFFDSIDIFCLPSLQEPFGITLLEAMANKKVIIATNTDGPMEILIHKKDALIVQAGNTKALAQAMMALIQNPQVGRKYSTCAYKRYQEHYTLEAGTARISQHIAHILKRLPKT